jgi:glycine cleavage system H protein
MNIDDLRFTKEHEWVALENGASVVTVGITDFAQGELGDIVYVEFPEVGAEVRAAEAMGTIEAVKTVADLYAPLSGVITEINGVLEDDPGVVNKSPYEDGWFVKMKLSDPGELDGLLSHGAYKQMIGAE